MGIAFMNAVKEAFYIGCIAAIAIGCYRHAELWHDYKQLQAEYEKVKEEHTINIFDVTKIEDAKLTIGIKNNNPMNIKGKGWEGQKDDRKCVDKFGHAVFENVMYGLRAGARNLVNMQKKSGCKTVRQYIMKYCEANQDKYIEAMSRALGVDADEEFDIYDKLMPMMRCIVRRENGYDPYPATFYIPFSFVMDR